MNSSFKDGVQFAWDASSITLAQTCLRKYQLKMIEGWHPHRQSVHLTFGSLYATALEHYHKYQALGMSQDEAEETVVREALIATWEDGKPWESDHNTKTRETLIRTIVWYFTEFRDDPMEVVILENGKPAVELSFRIPIIEENIILTGHIDRLVRYNGDIYVQDQKTTGNTITQRYFDNWSPDVQMSQYTFAGKIGYQIPVKGVVLDVAQIAVGFTRFERGMVFRTPAQLDEWYADSLYWIRHAQEASRTGIFPMNRTACGNYGGCEFRPICSRDSQVRENFLKADFEVAATWDPLSPR